MSKVPNSNYSGTILWTNQLDQMTDFYENALGFTRENDFNGALVLVRDGQRLILARKDLGVIYSPDFLKTEGDNYTVSMNIVMKEYGFEDAVEYLERRYHAKKIFGPKTMPWAKKLAVIQDPDGNHVLLNALV